MNESAFMGLRIGLEDVVNTFNSKRNCLEKFFGRQYSLNSDNLRKIDLVFTQTEEERLKIGKSVIGDMILGDLERIHSEYRITGNTLDVSLYPKAKHKGEITKFIERLSKYYGISYNVHNCPLKDVAPINA